jgi:formylglycine-generating enzyme required for sulfatase activity
MRVLLALSVGLLLCASALPRVARVQQRGLTTGGAQAGAARYYALVIGNNNYTTLPKLKTAEADARAVAALLKEAYGFETKLLLNATRAQIVSALSTYRRELPVDASLLVYYAGHGFNDKETDKAYWLPVDAERDDQANWIIADEITTGIRAIPARHVLVVSDSCYSGTLTRTIGEMLPRPTEREQFLQRMAAGRSRTLIASGGNEPVADGGGSGHSVFAAALLRGLREMDKGQFTAAELYNSYVLEAVAGRAQQTPVYALLQNSGHESGDFVFVKVKVGDKTVEVTVKAPPTGAVDSSVFELEYWNAIKDSSDPEEYQGYLKQYPNGRFADIARRRASGGRGGNGTARVPSVSPSPESAANTTGVARPSVRPQQMQNRTGIEFVWVPAGSFMMGSGKNSPNEKPMHRVTIAEGFYIGKYEVTQAQWQQVMGSNPSKFKDCANCPVERVSWDSAQAFISKLNAQNDGYIYRLPSEAEWEYAARAGTTTAFAFGDSLSSAQANFDGGYPYGQAAKGVFLKKTTPVGNFEPNAFGLFDMHGNVREWVQDYYHDSYVGAPTDGSAWERGGDQTKRVSRGGSWFATSDYCRSANRVGHSLSDPGYDGMIGLRLVAVPRG